MSPEQSGSESRDVEPSNPESLTPESHNPSTGQIRAQYESARAEFEKNVEHARAQFEKTAEQARVQIEKNVEQARAQFEEVQVLIQKRTGRNLIGAIAVGILLGGSLLASLLIDKQLFIFFAIFLLGIASFELATAMRHRRWYVPRYLSTAVTVGVVPVAFYWGMVYAVVAILAGLAIIFVWMLVRLSWWKGVEGATVASSFAASAFTQGYVTFFGAFTVALVAQPNGQWWTIAFLIVVVSVDIGAYSSGLMFGKHLLAPRISPKKTWEGFAGAGIVASIAGVLVTWLMLHEVWWTGIVLGLLLLVVATWGDLGESYLKRVIGIKDMSNWLAGHGGFLDRIDSILPSGVVVYIVYFIVQLLKQG